MESWEHGNLSQKEYCRKHKLNFHSFSHHRQKYLHSEAEPVKSPSGFVELPLLSPNGELIQGGSFEFRINSPVPVYLKLQLDPESSEGGLENVR